MSDMYPDADPGPTPDQVTAWDEANFYADQAAADEAALTEAEEAGPDADAWLTPAPEDRHPYGFEPRSGGVPVTTDGALNDRPEFGEWLRQHEAEAGQ